MTKRMLIDATHAEETRVVVLDGNRLEDFDVETSTKRQLKGNIYLAKVVRVEPSLQAAFVEYGGNRHGFLAFGEIHPDYYQIPVADRQRLLDMQAEEARREEEEEDRAAAAEEAGGAPEAMPATIEGEVVSSEIIEADRDGPADDAPDPAAMEIAPVESPAADMPPIEAEAVAPTPDADAPAEPMVEVEAGAEAHAAPAAETEATADVDTDAGDAAAAETAEAETGNEGDADRADETDEHDAVVDVPPPETVGGVEAEDTREPRVPSRMLRNYKIQEVIRRRQILLIQVVKEERGTKGAALTTYISLAGRFCVLMPNSPRGGGISRKITSAADRRRLKEITAEMEIPRGMGLIVRTAGASRPKAEIRRDCEYLMRMWDEIRELTMRSVAPALIYEEASLIKRAIRDVYSRDVDDILVDGEAGWHAAHDFMRMLMPSHARKVQLWREPAQTLFGHYQVEAQLDAMLSPTVQLRSGGYLVINQTEALVAIDVNSGRSTRERGIEETALRTNLEAAEETARQLRLRDLAGLIVIDFIDMEQKKHNAMVERRIKEALKDDRARIQLGHISHFGLLEMSRQRLRPSLAETSFIPCPHCGGTGHVRSTESAAIHVLRAIEDEGAKRRAAEIVVHVAPAIAMFILNHKRERLSEIETRHGLHAVLAADDRLIPPDIRIERVRTLSASDLPAAITPESAAPLRAEPMAGEDAEEIADETMADDAAEDAADEVAPEGETAEEGEIRRRRRRRRRGRGRGREDGQGDDAAPNNGEASAAAADATARVKPTRQPPRPRPRRKATAKRLKAATRPKTAPPRSSARGGADAAAGAGGGARTIRPWPPWPPRMPSSRNCRPITRRPPIPARRRPIRSAGGISIFSM